MRARALGRWGSINLISIIIIIILLLLLSSSSSTINTIQRYCQVSVQLHEECFVVPSALITHSLQS